MGDIINFHLTRHQRLARADVSQSLTISSSETHHRPGNPPRSRRHRNCHCGRNTIWRELFRSRRLELSESYLFRHRSFSVRSQRGCSPCDGLDMRDFSRVQKGIRGAAKSSPDIESDNKFSRRARVTGAGCFHHGGQIKRSEITHRPTASNISL